MDSSPMTLAALSVSQDTQLWSLKFERANLYVIHEYGTLSWFIDVDGVADESLLAYFAAADDIAVTINATTIGGRGFKGHAYFHANPLRQAAAIRGEGKLEGYDREFVSRSDK